MRDSLATIWVKAKVGPDVVTLVVAGKSSLLPDPYDEMDKPSIQNLC